jgi:hypothetical protein
MLNRFFTPCPTTSPPSAAQRAPPSHYSAQRWLNLRPVLSAIYIKVYANVEREEWKKLVVETCRILLSYRVKPGCLNQYSTPRPNRARHPPLLSNIPPKGNIQTKYQTQSVKIPGPILIHFQSCGYLSPSSSPFRESFSLPSSSPSTDPLPPIPRTPTLLSSQSRLAQFPKRRSTLFQKPNFSTSHIIHRPSHPDQSPRPKTPRRRPHIVTHNLGNHDDPTLTSSYPIQIRQGTSFGLYFRGKATSSPCRESTICGQVSSKSNFAHQGVENCGQEHRTTHLSSEEGGMQLMPFVYGCICSMCWISSKSNFEHQGVESCGQEHRTTHLSSAEGCMHLISFVYRYLLHVLGQVSSKGNFAHEVSKPAVKNTERLTHCPRRIVRISYHFCIENSARCVETGWRWRPYRTLGKCYWSGPSGLQVPRRAKWKFTQRGCTSV